MIAKFFGNMKKFKQAEFVSTVIAKGFEVGYNFFKVEGTSARSKAGILIFAMIFYVVYMLWYGVAILWLFEGFGMEMKAGVKKEV